MQIEHRIIKLLLSHDFYMEHSHAVTRTMFPDELATIYDTIKEAHTKYSRDITIEEVAALHRVLNPTLTHAARNNILDLLDDVKEIEGIGEDIAEDIINAMWRKEIGNQIAQVGYELSTGEIETLQPLTRLLETVNGNFSPDDEIEYVTSDLQELLDDVDKGAKWKFNIASISDKIPGGSGGDFAIFFARPEAGKTAFHVSLSCAPDGFCWQGADVHVLVNEEKGTRTKVRAACAAAGMTKEELRADFEKGLAEWAKIRDKYHMIDEIDMTIESLNAYCEKNKPNVLIIDQLDKIKVDGEFARDDQRLREIYIQAREIAKRHDCFVIGICQASADAEGKTFLTYVMMEGSKTGKAAEADLIIGIGMRPVQQDIGEEEDHLRFIGISKNKISGWHGKIPVIFDRYKTTYRA